MKKTNTGRPPLLPTSAKRLSVSRIPVKARVVGDDAKPIEPGGGGGGPSSSSSSGGGPSTEGRQGVSVPRAIVYILMLILGMSVALLLESLPSSTDSAKTSSLYGDVLSPRADLSKARKPAVRVVDTAPARPQQQQQQLKEPPKEEPAAAAEERTPKNVAATMAAVKRTPIPDLWASPKQFKHTEFRRCSNSCPFARNGVCEDGTAQGKVEQGIEIKCDLGTDCDDCGGGWQGKATGSVEAAAMGGTMIRDLAEEGTQVLMRTVTIIPEFKFAYTNPKHDVDVSGHVHHSGAFEQGMTFVWYRALAKRCKASDLVVDVGGNFGWYTVFAASLGCRVVTWEPVPRFRAFLLYNVLLNNLGHLVEIRDAVVANTDVPQTVMVPQRGIWGTAGIGGLNIDPAIDNQGAILEVVSVPDRLDDVIQQDAALLKVDVEGYEPDVFETASRLINQRKIDHIFMEYSPGVGERKHDFNMIKRFPVMLQTIIRSGYSMRSFDTPGAVYPEADSWESMEEGGPAAGIPLFESVLDENIKYDILDADNGPGFGCVFKPPEVKKMRMHMNCAAMPEGFHPMSFHSVFSHNTNVWAVKGDLDVYPKGAVTGVIKPHEDLSGYFTTRQGPHGAAGMGGRICEHLPPEVQVHHRCRCTVPDQCGKEEKIVEEAYRNHIVQQ